MAGIVARYVNDVTGLMYELSVGDPSCRLLVEQKLPISKITGEPDAFGTADVIILGDKTLAVVDLKTGHTPVEVEDNEQLEIYTAAAILHYKVQTDSDISVHIFQSSLSRNKSVGVDMSYLLTKMREMAKPIGEHALSLYRAVPDYLLGLVDIKGTPEETQCMYCPAGKAQICKARTEYVQEATAIELMAESGISEAELAQIGSNADKVAMIRRWCDDAEALMTRHVLSGDKVPGWKPVKGREGNRAWLDEDKADKTLARLKIKMDDRYTMTLKSPAKVEALIKEGLLTADEYAKKLAPLVTRSEAKTVAAPVKDKRPEVVVDKILFSPIEDQENVTTSE
jgi:uncharacterized protein YjbK